MVGDYEHGFYCQNPPCVAVLNSKNGSNKSRGRRRVDTAGSVGDSNKA